MSGRPTAEIVAELTWALEWVMRPPHERRLLTEVRNRLADLDAKESDLNIEVAGLYTRLNAIDALRPPCPTCGGDGGIATASTAPDPNGYILGAYIDCPAKCDHGKVSIEQLVATWRAVHDERRRFDGTTRDYLIRSVKP